MYRHWLAIALIIVGFGCSGKTVDESNPQALYDEALEDIQNDRYIMAVEKLRSVRNKFPYSKVATQAHLKMADVYFAQESYVEAAAAYEAFRDLHPKHESAAYASFKIGEAYRKDIPTVISRDLTSAYKAQDALRSFLEQYPQDAEVPKAKVFLQETRDLLASKETYIGDFYYKKGEWDAAKIRYQKILDMYADTNQGPIAKNRLEDIQNKK